MTAETEAKKNKYSMEKFAKIVLSQIVGEELKFDKSKKEILDLISSLNPELCEEIHESYDSLHKYIEDEYMIKLGGCVPDAYRIDTENRTIEYYEIEDTNKITIEKLAWYFNMSEVLFGTINYKLILYSVNRYGNRIEEIPYESIEYIIALY